MAKNINKLLEVIKKGIYGREVRDAIHDGIEQAYNDASKNGNANLEVIKARGQHEVLGNRLDETEREISTKVNKGGISVYDIDKSKGKLDQSFMSDDFLKQIAGDAEIHATVKDLSLTENKTTFKPMISDSCGKNLFNSARAQLGKRLNSESGAEENYELSFLSDFIEIKPKTAYTLTLAQKVGTIVFYDYDYKILKVIRNTFSFVSPDNSRFLRFSAVTDTSLTTAQVEQDSGETNFEEYKHKIDGDRILEGSITNDKLDMSNIVTGKVGKNLFDKSRAKIGFRVIKDGVGGFESAITNAEAYFLSHKIKVEGNKDYYLNSNYVSVHFYDSKMDFIDWKTGSGGALNPFKTPANCEYIYFSGLVKEIDNIQLEQNSVGTPYEPYLVIPKGLESIFTNSLSGKLWVIDGDSNSEINDTANKKYYNIISEETGINFEVFAQSGRGYLPSFDTRPPIHENIEKYPENADIITIFAGGNNVNDVHSGKFNLGSLGDADPYGSYYGALDYTFRKLIERFPLVKIGAISQTKRGNHDDKEETLNKMVKALKEVCGFYGIPVLDLYNCGNIHAKDRGFLNLVMPDNVHFNDYGHKLIANKIKNFITSL